MKTTMKKQTLTHSDGRTVEVWPIDVAGWAKFGFFQEGAEVPEDIGEDMLEMSHKELDAIVEKENLAVAFASKDTIQDKVNKILAARQLKQA